MIGIRSPMEAKMIALYEGENLPWRVWR